MVFPFLEKITRKIRVVNQNIDMRIIIKGTYLFIYSTQIMKEQPLMAAFGLLDPMSI